MRVYLRPALAPLLLLGLTGLASAQQAEPQKMPFAGGELTITENEDFEKVLAFNGEEIARNYVAFFDKTVTVADVEVALVSVGDGGNACGAATVLVWKPEGEGIRHDIVGEDCGAPPAAVTETDIYFVPYLLPGATEPVQKWSPATGVQLAGTMSFAPQPGTGWADLKPDSWDNIIDALGNEAAYNAAKALLGDDLTGVITGLLVGGGYQTSESGVWYSSGCVPHACGSSDAFMGVDGKNQKLYFAQAGEGAKAWPPLADWPADLAAVMTEEIAFPR